jgi:hypothetical protein
MRREKAVEALEQLRDEAGEDRVKAGGEGLTAWKAKVRGVLAQALGTNDNIVKKFDSMKFHYTGISHSGMDRSVYTTARHARIRDACGLIEAALHQLDLLSGDDEPVDERAFDPDLWNFVKGLVEDEDWGKVASQTAIFVESHVRDWADDPKDRHGDSLIGKVLFSTVFADESDWRLGARAGEREGWRFLGMGFAQALSNVDRHRIQKRDDARRYAIGVLGLGSLLLTQMRFEHSDLIEEAAGSLRE